jgi:hypothetical protein
VVLASYLPVLQLLEDHGCRIVIVFTCSPQYFAEFVQGLGFKLPGTVVIDRERLTHRACGLQSSVYASLVMPFRQHLATFGRSAVLEALRVSLMNATPGHGSSWQQGAAFVFKHPGGACDSATCMWAWREDYPGDWKPVHKVLDEALGITGAPVVSFPERLDFVIACRSGSSKGVSGKTLGASGARPICCRRRSQQTSRSGSDSMAGSSSASKRESAGGGDGCDEGVCTIDAVRRQAEAAMNLQ